MADSIPNFDDLSYSGILDTADGFSGSSTLQDVQLGSPLLLDTNIPNSVSVTDFMNVPTTIDTSYSGELIPGGPDTPTNGNPNIPAGYGYGPNENGGVSIYPVTSAQAAQALSGTSDTPPSPVAASNSSPNPSVAPMNASSAAGLSALAKFGASIGAIFGGSPVNVAGSQPRTVTIAGGALVPGAASGTTTIILLVVVGVIILLLVNGGE